MNGYDNSPEAYRALHDTSRETANPWAVNLRMDTLNKGEENLNRIDKRLAASQRPVGAIGGEVPDIHERFGPQVDAAMSRAANADSGIAQQHAAEVADLAARRAQRLSKETRDVADTVAISVDGQLQQLQQLHDLAQGQVFPYEEAA